MISGLRLPQGPYVLSNLTLPKALCGPSIRSCFKTSGSQDMMRGDLGFNGGVIVEPKADWPNIDATGLMALPPFVDAHVHLDKAYTVQRSGLGDGTLLGAIGVMAKDAQRWTRDDLFSRMRRGVERALAHGTGVIRTHLDTVELPDDTESWDVLKELQNEFADKIILQPVALGAVERALQDDFDKRCQQVATRAGVMGAFIAPGPAPLEAIRALLLGAGKYGLDVDFHVDENLRDGPNVLSAIADIVLETDHPTSVVAGHCCNLSLLKDSELVNVLDRVKEAGIHIIALPTTNSFLQDRNNAVSPRRRGIAPVLEMLARGVKVSTASDNVQDAFFPFGDFDMLEVLRMMIVTGHLDQDLDRAMMLGFDAAGLAIGRAVPHIEFDAPADFTLFQAQGWLDLLSNTQVERKVVRRGNQIEQTKLETRGIV